MYGISLYIVNLLLYRNTNEFFENFGVFVIVPTKIMLRFPSGIPPKQRRIPITNTQKRALRQLYHSTPPPKPKYDALQQWWAQEFGNSIGKSSISEILSSKYEYLDTSAISSDTKRTRAVKWEVLEECLFEWEQRYEATGNTITGDVLRYKATELWNKLPEYIGQDCPSWSEGWLAGFKKRYHIKARRQFGEAASAQIGEETDRIMADIREEAAKYEAGDVYNMDETGYCWKTMPDRSLGTSQHAGGKKEKARITATLCCNATGTDRLPIWYIGKAAHPNCFRSARIRNLESLGATWRSNAKAWMDHNIMVQWLKAFVQRMRGRKVLLLMDNFGAHCLAVDMMRESGGLENVTIKWLPPNATSIHQPLDQGIIKAWKAYI